MKLLMFLFFIAASHNYGQAKPMFLLRLISDKDDTTDISVKDVDKIDTIKNLLVLNSIISERLRQQNFAKGSAILNIGGELIKVNLHEVLAAEYKGAPSITINQGQLFIVDKNSISIAGDDWKKIVLKNNLP